MRFKQIQASAIKRGPGGGQTERNATDIPPLEVPAILHAAVPLRNGNYRTVQAVRVPYYALIRRNDLERQSMVFRIASRALPRRGTMGLNAALLRDLVATR